MLKTILVLRLVSRFTVASPQECGLFCLIIFGCPFAFLFRYSPLHNVRKPWDKPFDKVIQYPSTMLLTADHDDRVVPLHSLKLLAVRLLSLSFKFLYSVSFPYVIVCSIGGSFYQIFIHWFLLQTMQHVLCTSRERSPQTNPIVGRIEHKAGHGAGRPTQKMVHVYCNVFFHSLCQNGAGFFMTDF